MIRYWDYRPEYEQGRQEILGAVDRVFSSGRLILGPEVQRFEERFSAYCGVLHGIGVNSGTDALFLALRAADIGPEDEVLTVSNTAVPTVSAIRATGARPVFVEVDESTFLMDTRSIEERVTRRTRAILPVHLLGQTVAMAPLLEIADRRELTVIEDCAQATGAEYRGRKAGSFGALSAFSFYPTKLLGGYGDGGMVLTSEPALAEKVRRLRFYGMQDAYYSLEEGYNSRLDEVHAAILARKLDLLAVELDKRRAIAGLYTEGLAATGDLRTPATAPGCTHRYYAYTIRTSHRDALQAYLLQRGIETKINYPTPVHLMTGYAFLGYREGDLPVTERLAREILSLPLYPDLPIEDAHRVIDAVRSFFAGSAR